MKKYVIDTNALISFVTDRDVRQQEVVAPLFSMAARSNCSLLCHQSVLTEFVYVMDKVYGVQKEQINAMVRDFIAMPGVELIQETDFNLLLSLWPASINDYGDALVATTAKATKGATLLTFYNKFRSASRRLGLLVFEPGPHHAGSK